ncbi:MAG: hypothetical protein AB1774_01725, partial [Bacillota bacterium]
MPFNGNLVPTEEHLSMAVLIALSILAVLVFTILAAAAANRALSRKVRATIKDLSESEAKYRQLIENAGDGMFVASLDGT